MLVLWSAQGWLTGQFGAVLQRLLVAAMAALLGGAMLRSWAGSRAGPMRPETARALIWSCVALMVLAVGVSLVKEAALRQPVPPPALLAVLATMTGATAFLLLAPWLRHSAWPSDGPTPGPPRMLVRGVLAFVAVVPLGTALLGRAVLATYLFNRALAVLVLIWTVAQLRKVAHESLRSALDRPPQALADAPPAEEEVPDAPARIASYWAALAVDIVLALVTFRLLLQLLDIPQVQIDYWTGLAFGDIQVGGAVISLPDILLAMLVLAGGLFASSRLRRWLGKSVLPRSGMEIGLRTSIAAGAGYLGMVLAILAAIATAGISLSSVAIVAGALSVGMGFGLRTVVENFVAGLLMLIERPVRVGDWVVIGDTEGTVRRISVRATEIETFDSASVVVPNSLFVSSPVTNWTLQNRRGRIHVKVGVGYEADPAKVQALLLECARANRAGRVLPGAAGAVHRLRRFGPAVRAALPRARRRQLRHRPQRPPGRDREEPARARHRGALPAAGAPPRQGLGGGTGRGAAAADRDPPGFLTALRIAALGARRCRSRHRGSGAACPRCRTRRSGSPSRHGTRVAPAPAGRGWRGPRPSPPAPGRSRTGDGCRRRHRTGAVPWPRMTSVAGSGPCHANRSRFHVPQATAGAPLAR